MVDAKQIDDQAGLVTPAAECWEPARPELFDTQDPDPDDLDYEEWQEPCGSCNWPAAECECLDFYEQALRGDIDPEEAED
jgi:hypothetical protein